MRALREWSIVAPICVLAAFAVARADVVHLKNGGKVEGRIVEENPASVVVDTGGLRASVDRADVESIERAPPPAPTVSVRSGPHFRVTCHFVSDSCAEEALAAAEAAWPATIEFLGAAPVALERPLDIHVYRKEAEFAAVDAKLNRVPMTKDHNGFSYPASRTAYLVVRPDYDEAAWKRVGAPRDALVGLAHEASHLTAFACLNNAAYHPEWLKEGMAQHVERRVFSASTWGADPALYPATSYDMTRCLRLRREGLLPEPRAIFQSRLGHLDVADRYAVHWAFFEFLLRQEQRSRTDALLATARVLPSGDDLGRRLSDIAEKLWNGKGLDALNEAFRAHVDEFAPTWDIEYGGAFDVGRDSWVESATDAVNAVHAWRVPGAARPDFRVSGAFEILAGDKLAAVELGRTDAGAVVVDFTSKNGLWLYERRYADDSWRSVANSPYVPPAAGARIEFVVHVVGDTIRVDLAGREVLSGTIAGRALTGPWGVTVNPGTTALWTGVKLE
jgi:hypothetical protein